MLTARGTSGESRPAAHSAAKNRLAEIIFNLQEHFILVVE